MSANTISVPKSNLAQRPQFKEKYEHYIDGKWVAPASGTYFDKISPIDGKVFTQAARANAKRRRKSGRCSPESICGYKTSGFGHETHKMMLNHYRQTKNMLISYGKQKLGFF
jgi:aldehyde dehydrogenase